MKCPHCRVEINPNFKTKPLINSDEYDSDYCNVNYMVCPNNACKQIIIDLIFVDPIMTKNGVLAEKSKYKQINLYPTIKSRNTTPPEVDKKFADDYNEACTVLPFSPKASAALSRRCLQNIIREKAGITKRNLSQEIDELINIGNLPSYLSESIDAVRNIGNFAAHPIKSTSSGEIVPVEPGEAEWLLDVIESLFDFYFVQPAKLAERRNALNQKLKDAGKNEMK